MRIWRPNSSTQTLGVTLILEQKSKTRKVLSELMTVHGGGDTQQSCVLCRWKSSAGLEAEVKDPGAFAFLSRLSAYHAAQDNTQWMLV